MELQSKLEAYRAKKNRDEKINNLKAKFKSFVNWKKDEYVKDSEQEELLDDNCSDEEILPQVPQGDIEENVAEVPTEPEPMSKFKKVLYIVGFTVWATVYYIFIKLQFGIIYLILSALFGMYFNTRTGPRHANEASAYSVFNRNCESIDGTLTAEQFEREIRFGAQSVR